MAKVLQNIFAPGTDEIAQTYTIESWHVSQSVDAFTAATDYDISVSGSITLTGQMQQGNGTTSAVGFASHAEGQGTTASGPGSHAEGYLTSASGDYSHAEGQYTKAIGLNSHAEGQGQNKLGTYTYNIAEGKASHVEGFLTSASGDYSHAEGDATQAIGEASHAEGLTTQAIGEASHAEGIGTIASGSYQHVSGKYNKQGDDTSLFIVGNGTSDGSRKDAFKVTWSSSIAITTTQSVAPTWTGVDGEIVAATVTGTYYLYMWMNKAWRSSSFA